MEEIELHKLEQQIDDLISTITKLQNENSSLKTDKSALESERIDLIKKTELAKERVEKMITRLKTIEDAG
ncbi:MAG: TIGR02449 family protein [Thiohalomonadales bacterium]